jgi:serine/threonine protein kinase
LAVLERKKVGLVTADMLLTDWIDAPDLSILLTSSEAEERVRKIASAARSIAALHAASCRHRDLKASNLLSTPGGPEVLLADLDGARVCVNGPSCRRRLRDLSRLMVSLVVFGGQGGHTGEPSDADIDRSCATDGALLLERYLEASPGLEGGGDLLQSWQAQATALVRRKVSVNLRAGRPLS